MTESNALDGIVDTLLEIVAPLAEATRDDAAFGWFLADIGWTAHTIDLDDVAAAVQALLDTVESLGAGLSFDDLPALVESLASLGETVVAVADFATALGQAAGDPAASAEVIGELAADVLQHLVLTWIATRSAPTYGALALLGIIDRRVATAVATAGPDPLLQRAAVERPVLAPEAFAALLSDPVGHLRTRLGIIELASVEAAELLLRTLFTPIRELVVAAGGTASLGSDAVPAAAGDPVLRRAAMLVPLPIGGDDQDVRPWVSLLLELVPSGAVSPAGDAGPGLSVEPGGGVEVTVPLPGSRLELRVTAGIGSVFFAQGGPPVVHAESTDGVHVRLDVTTVADAAGTPAIVLGADTLGLTIGGVTAGVEARFGRRDDPGLDLDLRAGVQNARFRLAPGEGDGFLGKVLPADGLGFDFDLGIGWSTRRGLYFSGAASLEAEFPLHVSLLGVLTIDLLHLRLAADDAGFGLTVAATAGLKLGPIAASVERMGLGAQVALPPGGGNVGPFDISPRFVPPRGAGMVIDASVVVGGGYVLNDPDNGRYAGILQLKIGDIVTVTAIGLVTTKLPDGSPGFSLLVIITATFPPIQLGFGFNLSGLGGLLGLNRTMNVQALRDGARTGVLDSILFPVDPVARATKVISDVEAVFPVAPGRFVIGLMARIGWGSPRLVTVDLGVIIEVPLPLRIALIGRVGVVLPTADAAVVELNLDIVGIIDLGRGELSIDASLHDSRLAVFDISGDMAVRVGWGATPAFVVSVGGLNPRFERPPGLPDLRRLTIALASGENPSVRLETYLALTSNTVQLGARLSVHAELDAGALGLFGADAYFGFDALVTIVPFEFIVDISGGIVITRNGVPFIGADVLLSLHGPEPMRAVGYAEVHFLGTHRIPFDVTVGGEVVAAALAAIDPLAALLAEVARIEAWSAQPPRDVLGVALRDVGTEELLAHPRGELTVRQRAVPLGVRIERFGGAPIDGGPREFMLGFRVGGTPASSGEAIRDAWAPGDLFTLTDDEKLSRPSFERLQSGNAGIGGGGVTFGAAREGAEADYETRVIDDELSRPADGYRVPASVEPLLVAAQVRGAPGYRGPDLAVRLTPQAFRVADTATLAADGGEHPSWIEAAEAQAGRSGRQVVGAHEVATA
ncbi:DUF6603 domain-containing protein [Micromonospora sp. CPCC 205539]|uniref:DUF6603 domain-containing protein n=1 Tax=Micromonospora sp. CPCC 205539 TaxID=3122408 RepID=UPI002FF41DB3